MQTLNICGPGEQVNKDVPVVTSHRGSKTRLAPLKTGLYLECTGMCRVLYTERTDTHRVQFQSDEAIAIYVMKASNVWMTAEEWVKAENK